MTRPNRYCASPEVVALLARDGIGWGHDLDCGCFTAEAKARPPGRLRRIVARLAGRS